MNINEIIIKGAREHNLKNVNLVIPRNKLIVMTGLSGSGKSSLAFDTIYAEGQRRYVESLSSYARQFLGQMDKPDVDYIEGLSPAISIDQKTTSRNPRSTVGTVTEIHDYLRLMYARIGVPHCPSCGKPIRQQTVDQIVDRILALPERTRLMILAPVVRGRKGEFVKMLEDLQKQGYVRGTLTERVSMPAKHPDESAAYYTGVVQCKDSFFGQHDPERMPVGPELQWKWEAWKKMGCLASEMESAAMFIVGAKLHARVGTCLLVVANQEREKLGLYNPVVRDTDQTIRTAIDAVRSLIREDQKNKE